MTRSLSRIISNQPPRSILSLIVVVGVAMLTSIVTGMSDQNKTLNLIVTTLSINYAVLNIFKQIFDVPLLLLRLDV